MLLYDGNRVMLFRTALALMELYGTWLQDKIHIEYLSCITVSVATVLKAM